jgi:hypothetical protein
MQSNEITDTRLAEMIVEQNRWLAESEPERIPGIPVYQNRSDGAVLFALLSPLGIMTEIRGRRLFATIPGMLCQEIGSMDILELTDWVTATITRALAEGPGSPWDDGRMAWLTA